MALRQVKASAGSGKTYDLTQRFLAHVSRSPQEAHSYGCSLGGSGWGDILAVTFTNSAATEMKERVVRRLKECALGLAKEQGLPADEAARWVEIILHQYGALNIRTIDSLLHLVVRTAALDMGLPPDFEPVFATEDTLAPILDICLERAWQGDTAMLGLLREACRALLYHGQLKGFTVGERLNKALLPLLDMVLSGKIPALSPPDAVEKCMHDIHQTLMAKVVWMRGTLEKEKLPAHKLMLTALERCAHGDLKGLDSVYMHKDCLDDCLNTKGKGKASDDAHRAYAQLKAARQRHLAHGRILRDGLRLHPFIQLTQEVAAGLELFQQQEGKVPGALMPLLARQVLSLEYGVPAALCRLGSGLNHLLVDEFQDTSREQWDALRPLVEEALSRGGSLTFVGDVKQAIYGWRGGDAALFDEVLEDNDLTCMIEKAEQRSLDTNWRSHENVVHCNNALFARLGNTDTARTILGTVMPADCPSHVLDNASKKLVSAFANAAQKTCGKKGGHVTITPVMGATRAEQDENIHEALRARLLDDLAQRRRWGDITILVRANKDAALTAAWLMEWGVPVITENSLLLAEHPLVAESIAFLAFLDAQQDDLAFWTVLTGSVMAPCVENGPGLAQLQEWALTRRGGYLCMALREDFPEFWQRWFAPFHGKAALLSPYDTIQEWYSLLQVPQRFPEARTFLRRFLEVLHTAGERGSATLNAFLEHWKDSGGDEKVPMPTGMDAVSIMTIHKAKGLQFPVVIVPWTGFTIKPKASVEVQEIENLHVAAPLCPQMGDIYHEAQAIAAREALHLFYVALTRPEEELHLFHAAPNSRQNTLSKALDILFPLAGFTLPHIEGTPLHTDTTPDPQSDAAPPSPLPSSQWLHADTSHWRPMHWLPRLKVFRNPLQEMQSAAQRRGLLAHQCLELLQYTGHPAEDAQRAVFHTLRGFALPMDDDQFPQKLTHMLTWYAALPDAQRWMRQGLPEQEIFDEKNTAHRVDRLVPPDSLYPHWTAIEYKTGHEDTALHMAQLERYLRLLDSLPEAAGLPPARGVLVYLDLQKWVWV